MDADYRLFKISSGDACKLEGDESPGGCVRFSPGQTTATLRILILPDLSLEGNEIFHLRIIYVRNGRRSRYLYLSTLRIIILDATRRKILSYPHSDNITILYFFIITAAYVEFVKPVVTLLESSGVNYIPLRRHGYLHAMTSVECRMRSNTAVGGSLPTSDFFIAPFVETVVFLPGESLKGTYIHCRYTTHMYGHVLWLLHTGAVD